jgi:hypothetical protein
MKGRPDGDWQLKIREEIGEEAALPLLIGLGFDGIWVDSWGYDDYGVRVRTAFDEVIGPSIRSGDEHTRFYDLTPLKEELAARGQTEEVLAAEAFRQLGVTPGD